ncbi:hypothetical protein GMB86_02820 [Terrilactibacillus sp. BCM23-1]|uniref:Uncharacterized protein n=1 Tax=Terrilactibacillus tamarindi TaxID=2599694 RepID=A0A6N8CP73_9BACI|nr:hypothetical protein [Terrilactibacillus tamarindi]MTT30947.1 hypothetical protein [Terrilactibacillus tamarindi]
MLTFEQKLEIIESFPELERRDVSLGRVNFQYNDSVKEKKNVVYHLHPNGNGYVYAGELEGYPTDDKGFVNIRDFNEAELHSIVENAIFSLSEEGQPKPEEETWINREKQTLQLIHEDEAWTIYAGNNLVDSFGSHEDAALYLKDEGFRLQRN